MFYAVQQDDKYILRFQYDPSLIAIVKEVPGRQWNPEQKYWTIPLSHLGWLIKGIKGTAYEKALEVISDEHINENATIDSTDKIPDIDISDVDHYVKNGYHLYNHQLDFLKYAKNKGQKGFILADDMGCVSGDAIVTVNVGGGSKKMTLEKLYNRFHRLTPQSKRSNNPIFYIRCYKEDLGIFGLNRMRDIKFSGVKPVYRMTLSDGKSIKVTSDHQICTPDGYVELQNLEVGDTVVVNGLSKCINCGSTNDVITYKYAKFYGYCKSCMYRLRDGTINKGDSVGRRIDKGGYVVLNGKKFRGHPNYKNDGIYEHHYVMSQIIGRPIADGEIVHHIDENKQNNSPENLQLLTVSAHAKLHSSENTKNLWCDHVSRGNTIIVVPKYVTISSIEYVGDEATYDIVMENPYRNFIANGIVVHNCGKTLEILNFAMYQRKRYRYRHCLIITCVNSAKYSWQEDIDKHTNGMEQAYLLGTRVIKRGKRKGQLRYNGSGPDKVDDLLTGHMYGDESAPKLPYFIVTNIESLRTKVGKKFILADAIVQMIKNGDISIIAIDECHKNMSPQSTQGKVILDIKKQTGKMIQWIPMTGTPIKNKPIDVFTPLKLVDGHEIRTFFQWSHLFCIFGGFGGYEIMGYKNIPMLKDMLQGNMIRRMKSEVLDLPPKIYYNEYVDNTPYQEQLYDTIVEDIYEHKEEILSSPNPLTAMLRLRQVNGSPELVDDELIVDDKYLSRNAKLVRLLELIDDIVERDEKVVVFSNWVEPLRTIYKFLSKKHKTCCFTGTMSEADREKHKRVFINNPDYKVMLGTAGAMGVSLTLTVATNVIFYDDVWTAADKDQCEDRCFVKDTMVATFDGYKPIQAIKVGDLVYTQQGTLSPVTDIWSHDEDTDLMDIEFFGCPEHLICTPNHQFLVESQGWVEAQNLYKSDFHHRCIVERMCEAPDTDNLTSIPTNFNISEMYYIDQWGKQHYNGRKHRITSTMKLHSDFLFLCGYYIGDGFVSLRHKLSVSGHCDKKRNAMERIKRWFDANIEGTATFYQRKTTKTLELTMHNAAFADFISREFGRYDMEKHFPSWITELSKSQLKHIYDGLCQSDGYYRQVNNTMQQSYCTVNPKICSGVFYIVSRLGYRPNISVRHPKGFRMIYTIQWTLNPTYALKCGSVKSIKRIHKNTTLYDITVADNHNFYVWNIPVHNCNRIGSTEPLKVYTIMAKGTIDEKVRQIIENKRGIANFIVDNKLDMKANPQLFNFLLGRDKD